MKMKSLVAFLVVAIFWLGFFVTSQVRASEGDILLSDNFNDGDFSGWTIESGQWWINNGNLVGAKSGKAFSGRINTGNSEWDNYQIELDVNGFQGIDQGIGFRYAQNGSYEINLRYGTGAYDTPQIKLIRFDGTQATTLTDTRSFPIINQKWYHLKIEVLNENIKIWIDNTIIFDYTDTGTDIKKGTISLTYWTGDTSVAYMRFDNVKIAALAPPPPPRLPVIFIPGIGGSELKANQQIFWKQPDGHGGEFNWGYEKDEKIWVNQDKAAELGDDDYFDVLRLKADGITPEADLSLTGNLTSFGYPDIDSFFTDMGYVKGTNFFVFPYDWRKDVRSTKDSLDALIETAKTASGQSKVNLVVHSMGGLVARYYISDASKASKVNKLIELGVPHLGSVDSLKSILYGTWLARDFYLFKLGLPPSETHDVAQNMPSVFQLLPSKEFYNFYDNSDPQYLFPYRDDRDIDDNQVTGSLNFDQTKTLIKNLNHNMTIFDFGEQFHNVLDPLLSNSDGIQKYEIVGSGKDTVGQLRETWLIQWPINLIPIQDEIKIDGDGTVPTYSASLKNNSRDISGGAKIYYVEQEHSDLVRATGPAMQTVKAILNDDNSLPVEVKDQKFVLEGEQISLDDGELDLYDDQNRHCGLNSNGEIEENIPDVTCTTSGNTKHAFVKKKAAKVKVVTTRKKPAVNSKTTNLKIRTYKQDKISKTVIYKDIALPQTGKIEFTLDPASDISPVLTFYPDSEKSDTVIINSTSEVSGSAATDQTAPKTTIQISGTKDSDGIYSGPVTITLSGSDADSGILKIEYSLDDGETVQIYTDPFIISASGKTTIQVKAIDKLGNDEIPQSIVIEIAEPPTPTPSPTPTSVSVSSSTATPGVGSDSPGMTNTTTTPVIASEAKQSSSSISNASDVLGIAFENPNHISDQINIDKVLERKNILISNPAKEFLGGLLKVSGGIITLASLGLLTTFIKKVPHKM